MVEFGFPLVNAIAIAQNILESIFINGLWSAWGPMGVYFKANDFFIDSCRLEGPESPTCNDCKDTLPCYK